MSAPRRIRIGIVVPSSNTALEPEAYRLVATAPATTLHFSRVSVTRISTDAADSAQFDALAMSEAAGLLGDARVDVVAWGGTAGSWLGLEHDRGLVEAIAKAAGAPATTSTLALLEACGVLGVKRVGLVTPYTGEVVSLIRSTYEAAGLGIAGEAHLGLTDNFAFGDVGEVELRALAGRASIGGAEAVLVVCTNLRATGQVPSLEASLGLPVVDSIAATVWHAAVIGGHSLSIRGFGRLMEHDPTPALLGPEEHASGTPEAGERKDQR